MKKFDGILICSDLDGTLLRDDKSISNENLEAIEYFKSEGGVFTFITGRMPYFVSDIYNTVNPNAPFGCINGGGIYDHRTQKYVWTHEIDRSVIELVEYADKNIEELGIQVNTFETLYFCRENSAMEVFRQQTGMPKINADYKEITLPIAKIVFGDEDSSKLDRLEALLKAHPRAFEFDFVRSADILFEILPKDSNKGTLLPRLAEHLNIDMNRTVALGDYNNDINMLRTAKIGIAVANAAPEAKEAADYVTVSNEEHAIAKTVSNIELGVLKI